MDRPSARMPVVSFTLSAVSSAAAYASPRPATTRRSTDRQRSTRALTGTLSASTLVTAPGRAGRPSAGVAGAGLAGPWPVASASATPSRTVNCDVTVLVAGIARSGPASVRSATWAVSASGLPGSFVMPITTAPAARIAWQVVTISGVAPDWLIATTR